ncbi:MAG: universal stress protein [Pseudomonadota bacterium]
MAHLIAAIDGSAYSESVCDHAAWAARRLSYPVTVMHVLGRRDVASAPADLSGSIGLGARSELLEELAELDAQKSRLALKRGRAILDDAKARLEAAGVTTVDARLRHGELVETLSALEADAELLVIGKRGEAADFTRDHLGSNLERVVRSTARIVLVASRSCQPIARVLIAFDGGPSALKAVNHLATSPLFAGLHCHLLTVGTASESDRRDLEGAAALLREQGLSASHDLVPGQPEQVIGETAERDQFDLLVMGAYGHSRIRNLIIGSTTSEMLRKSRIPVLLFR